MRHIEPANTVLNSFMNGGGELETKWPLWAWRSKIAYRNDFKQDLKPDQFF
ncbi:hypothetical protein [Sphingobacterium sp.]|uniref:hypothetical protein n=1 Tax=Sphingobacterium sp. TaxID=341027 RepID=UPI0031D3D74F